MKWYCTCLGITRKENLLCLLCPFGVEAENYYEAVGKATEAMNSLKKEYSASTEWFVHVNKGGEKGLM